MIIRDIFNEVSKQTAWIEGEIQRLIIRLALAKPGSLRYYQLLERLKRIYFILDRQKRHAILTMLQSGRQF